MRSPVKTDIHSAVPASDLIEALVLAGGASLRMGKDKAGLLLDGLSLAERTVLQLTPFVAKVSVLGGTAVKGAHLIPDLEPLSGPLAALAGLSPTRPWVFVCACDLPLLRGEIVALLAQRVVGCDAAIPVTDGHQQPLCALYTAAAIESACAIHAAGQRSIKAWTAALTTKLVAEQELLAAGFNPSWLQSANTPAEFELLTQHQPA